MTNYSKENLEKIVKENNSLKDCIICLGLKPAQGNYVTLKKYLNLYNIDISCYKNNNLKGLEKHCKKIKITLENCLVKNSNYNRSKLKERLYKENLLKPVCILCGQNEYWNNMKISLIIDHINGISDDNRIENLRIVCPNCNAGLCTFAGKNIKSKKIEYFCECGNKICKLSKNCKKCASIKKQKTKRPTYEELKELLKTNTYVNIGKIFNVSDRSIHKWFENYQK